MESGNFHHQHEDHHHLVASFSWNGTNNIINSRTLDTSMGYPVDHELQCFARINLDAFSEAESYPKFLELLNCSPTSNTEDYSSYFMKNNQEVLLTNDQKCSNGILSQILPTISVPSSNPCNTSTSSSSTSSSLSSSSTSFDMNCLPALNMFGSPRYDGAMSYGFDRMIRPNHRPSVCPSKTTSVSTTERTDQSAKRPASKYEDAKETQSVMASKKSKLEPRSSSAPFQVRKQNLGDKVAALQQLVAPFGKTDTASVLMEAIGYIKFLQTQVETLSVPYMNSTNKLGGISYERRQMKDENREAKRDLRSRGLCLVPQSCLSYVTDGCNDP